MAESTIKKVGNSNGSYYWDGVWSKIGWGNSIICIPFENADKYNISIVACDTFIGNSTHQTSASVDTKNKIGFYVKTTDTAVEGYLGRVSFKMSS